MQEREDEDNRVRKQ